MAQETSNFRFISDFKDFLDGSKKPTHFQKLVQQPDAELAVLLRPRRGSHRKLFIFFTQ